MTKEVVSTQLGKGGSGIPDNLPNIVRELAGLSVAVVAGASAGTAMNIAAMRQEDTILSAIAVLDAAGSTNAGVNDAANCTIQSTRASGTLTVAGVNDGDACVVNGVTYTFKDAPSALNHVKRTAGNNNANAAAIAAVINGYETRYSGSATNIAAVTAEAVSAVVTVSSVVDGLGNGVILTGTATVLVAAGTGTASATLTPATVVATNTFVLAGVTFTARAAPTLDNEFTVKGTDVLQGAEIARAINYYQGKYGTLDASASASGTTGVVTIVPLAPKAGNIIVLTGQTRLAASGSGTLAGGTNTGSFKSTTDLSSKTVTVTWFNKR